MPAALTYTTLLSDARAYMERGASTDPSVYAQLPRLATLAQRRIARELKVQGFQQTVTSAMSGGVAVYQKPDRWRETISINIGTAKNTVTSVAVGTAGSGYVAPPTVTFSGGGGSGAAATAFIINGAVSQIAVTNAGSGYTTVPTVTLSAPASGGVQATATATISLVNNTRVQLYPRSYEFIRAYWPDDNQTAVPRFYADYDYAHWIFAPTPSASTPWEVLYYEIPALLDDSNLTNWMTEFAPELLLYAMLLECAPFLKNDERIPVWQQMYDRAASSLNGEDLQKILDRAAKRQRP